jgi:hypothetical protein
MSDLGRLFRLKSTDYVEPLENFTTAALAIAIHHDDQPIIRALRAVDSKCLGASVQPALAIFTGAAVEQLKVKAETQIPLWPSESMGMGYLDLVLTINERTECKATIWVEVKVDAFESGNQLATYEQHAALRSPPPAIITLARAQVNARVPSLKWADIRNAVTPDSHHSWQSLVQFLEDEKIVRAHLPPSPAQPDEVIEVIVDVSRRLSEFWPKTALGWSSEGQLRNSLRDNLASGEGLSTTGGPLRYGLMPAGDTWDWGLVVMTENYRKVALHADQMRRAADVGGLPSDWVRQSDSRVVLQRLMPVDGLSSHDEIVSWFDEGLRQLRDAGVLESYFSGLLLKNAGATLPSARNGSTVDQN